MTRQFALGSQNPVKRRATERCLDGIAAVELVTADVPSGVPDQPIGHAETRRGAINRAFKAREACGADLGLGIEGGIGTFPDVEDSYVIMWAAVGDGDAVTTASGPAIPMPAHVTERIEAGETLGSVIAGEFGDAAFARGAAGVLTGDVLDREDALRTTVAAAIGRHQTTYE